MLLKFLFFFCLYVSYIDCNSSYYFRFDYKYSREADGWLKFHRTPVTWMDARFKCHAEGAVLASPLSNKLRHAILDVIDNDCTVNTIFTGVHTTYSKAAFSSIEGVPISKLSFTWAPGEPDNIDNSQSCLAMQTIRHGAMMDVNCDDVLPFVCYKKRTEALEITECGTHDKEYSIDTRTRSCYKFHRHGLTWSKAYMTCMAEGGHLIIINSEQESDIITELFARNPAGSINSMLPQYAHIGTYDYNDGGSWMTIQGQTPREAGYSRWQPGEPNNGTQPLGEFCGCTQRGYPFLHDAPCNWVLPFICEKSPDSLAYSEEIY